MTLLLRLSRYLRPLWRRILLALLFMTLYALFSGFSIGLVLPIMDKVFLNASPQETPGSLPVGEGLAETWSAMAAAWSGARGIGGRFDAAKDAGVAGLERVQREAPPLEVLAWLCFFVLAAVMLKNGAEYGRRTSFIRVEERAAESLRNDLFRHLMLLPLSVRQRYPSGQLVSRVVTDVELVKVYTLNTAASFVHNLIQVLVFLSITLWASFRLSLVSFLIVPPILFVTARLASKLRKHSGRAQARIGEVTSALSETLGSARVVKAFGTEEREGRRFAEHTRQYRKSVVRLMSLDGLAAPLSEFWGVTIGVGVLYYGGKLVLSPDSDLTPGRFFVFFLALVSMLHPLKVISGVVTGLQRGLAAAGRLFEILDLPIETDDDGALEVTALRREIRFDGVSFEYEPGRPVLRDVSFAAPAGTTTALVGPSGGGKSTLVDLIPRFHDPTRGSVLLDGVDVRRCRRASLRRLTGIVTQETILFDDTVHNNIAYGVPAASREAVEAAASSANAHGFIAALPAGYDTVIGERGLTLSGGQRQRLAIARALLRNPAILVLDEATSSLDTESELAVQEALDRLMADRTTFVIAHRLSTVLGADQILVLDEGRIVERGTHRELLAEGRLYRRLYDLQFRDEAVV